MTFGRILRKYRKIKGLSQSGVSQLTNIPQTTLSDWETGKSFPNLRQLKILSSALNIPITEMLENIDEDPFN